MTSALPNDIPFLYLAQDDLFRLGNSGSAKLTHVRPDDVKTYDRNGVQMVRADGKGISLFDERGIVRLKGGWLWKIPRGTQLPLGLALHNDHGAHYAICPTHDMTVSAYKSLLETLALRCEKYRKV